MKQKKISSFLNEFCHVNKLNLKIPQGKKETREREKENRKQPHPIYTHTSTPTPTPTPTHTLAKMHWQ